MRLSRGVAAGALSSIVGFTAWSCGSDGNGATGDPNPVDGGKVGADAAHGSDGSAMMFGGDGGVGGDGNIAIMCEEACPTGLVCDHGFCEPPQAQCFTNASCEYDSYCDTKANQCVPYGSSPGNVTNDPNCKLVSPPGVLAPTTLCQFSTPPAGDPFPMHVDVQATPIVVNFTGAAASGSPSIVVPFTQPVDMGYTENLGVVRVLKGSDCTLLANLGGVDVSIPPDGTIDWVRSSSPVAVGDLDGDGIAEIVVYMGDDSTAAFTLKAGKWKTLWPHAFATLADGTTTFVSTITGGWAGPSIHDLDNDGKPEIVREGYVIDGQTGKLRAQLPASYAMYSQGTAAVIGDLDANGTVELVNGAHVWTFDGPTSTWIPVAAYEAQTSPAGWSAIADFTPNDGKKSPRIAVASNDTLAIYNLDHTPFMAPIAVPGTGGGPPTIADYDNDGFPEVGLAGEDFYTVFDPDCSATPPRTGGKCGTGNRQQCESAPGVMGPCPDYILWSKKTQDHSSKITGSSVFDFQADGTPEVVYADECFARVYSGIDGTVLFSQYHSSCTWEENPVVADVVGDFRSELVVPSNTACGPIGVGIACDGSLENGVDAEFAGLNCQQNSDCVSNQCDHGLCRCTAGAQCCSGATDAACLELGYACVAPPASTPGTGNTCRAAHPHGVQGIRVYKDAKDRWVRSRTIWNQHAYAVTHVNEDGTVPKTSQWVSNWTTAGLNNFRQNVPGEADGKDIGDLTAQAGAFSTCSSGGAVLSVPICNRGTAPVGAGIPVGFYVGTIKVCSAMTPSAIAVGTCVMTSCTWASPPTSMASETDVTVVPNDGDLTQECDTQNNHGLVEKVFCTPTR